MAVRNGVQMGKYPLVKLIQWAGPAGLHGRKRLQKVVFFLQQAGCPLDAEYTLHHYGPYSRDVAEACDELVASCLLSETPSPNTVGTQYVYTLPDLGRTAIEQTELHLPDQSRVIAGFKSLAEELIQTDLWELELGSTILFFRARTAAWEEATCRACEFKKIDRSKSPSVAPALALAQKVFAVKNAQH